MDSEKESFRQYVAGQLRLWEGKIARLNADLTILSGSERQEYEARLYELQRCNRTVFALFGNFLLASETQWEMKRQELDAAMVCMQHMLDEFTLQPAWSGVGSPELSH
jgi:hypothetical protein